ncbi:MAG: DNA glycosylase [Chthoniobacterales bacterium]
MPEIPCPTFDLAKTLESGQVFHWFRDGDTFSGLIGRELVTLRQSGDVLDITEGRPETVARYFALDHPLLEIEGTFPTDTPMTAAVEFCRGLRILRQEPWECLATFITSALKQVPHIRQISLDLRRRYGEKITGEFHAYPEPAALADAGEAALRESRLGFRAKNLAGAARMIADGEIDLESLRSLPTAELRRELCRLPGVGEKVANCVLLFAYERLEAFPIDVWIERVLRELYFAKKRKVTSQRLRHFSATHFGPYAGYAQQYLFHHARLTMKKRPSK